MDFNASTFNVPYDWVSPTTWLCLQKVAEFYLSTRYLYIHTSADGPATAALWPFFPVYLTSLGLTYKQNYFDEITIDDTATLFPRIPNKGRAVHIIPDVGVENMKALTNTSRYIDLVLIIPYNDYCDLYSWYPDEEMNLQFGVIDTWQDGVFLKNANLFPVKWDDRKLKVLPGFCQSLAYPDTLHGPEDRMVKDIAKSLDFVIEYVYLTEGILYNEIVDPKTRELSGYMNFLAHKCIDLTYGCNMESQYTHILATPLPSHKEERLVWSVFAPQRINSPSSLYSGFTDLMWSLIFVSMLSSTVIFLAAFDNELSVVHCISIVFRSAISQSAKVKKPKSTVFFIIVALFFLYCFHITCFYQSTLLKNLFTIHYEEGLSTLDEAVDAGLQIILNIFHYLMFVTENKGKYRNINVTENFDYTLTWNTKQFIKLGPLTTERYEYGRAFANGDYREKIKFLDEPFMRGSLLILVPTNYRHYAKLERKVLEVIQSGLFQHYLSCETNFLNDLRPVMKDLARPLGMDHLYFLMWGWCLFMFLSVVIFVSEFICSRSVEVRSKRKVWE